MMEYKGAHDQVIFQDVLDVQLILQNRKVLILLKRLMISLWLNMRDKNEKVGNHIQFI